MRFLPASNPALLRKIAAEDIGLAVNRQDGTAFVAMGFVLSIRSTPDEFTRPGDTVMVVA
jgi:hypothetical protein